MAQFKMRHTIKKNFKICAGENKEKKKNGQLKKFYNKKKKNQAQEKQKTNGKQCIWKERTKKKPARKIYGKLNHRCKKIKQRKKAMGLNQLVLKQVSPRGTGSGIGAQ